MNTCLELISRTWLGFGVNARQPKSHVRLLRIIMAHPSVQLDRQLTLSGLWGKVIMESSGDPHSGSRMVGRIGLSREYYGQS